MYCGLFSFSEERIDMENNVQTPEDYLNVELPPPTDEELQREYNYLLAEQFTTNLLRSDLITKKEFEEIMQKNRQSFQPFLSKIIV